MHYSYKKIICDLRKDNDKTQQEIADYLGIFQTMYARYKREANELPIRYYMENINEYNRKKYALHVQCVFLRWNSKNCWQNYKLKD